MESLWTAYDKEYINVSCLMKNELLYISLSLFDFKQFLESKKSIYDI